MNRSLEELEQQRQAPRAAGRVRELSVLGASVVCALLMSPSSHHAPISVPYLHRDEKQEAPSMVAAQETTLQKILEGTSQYVVPLYQRPYQWGPDNFKELWQDVGQLADDLLDDPEATHFLGSVVLAPLPAGVAGGVTRYLVVDGQQRLTTLTLLLAAIRDHLRDTATSSREGDRIHNQ